MSSIISSLAKCHKKIVAFDLLLSTQQVPGYSGKPSGGRQTPHTVLSPWPYSANPDQIDWRDLTTPQISSQTALGEDADNVTTLREPLTEQHPAQPLKASA